MKWLGALLVVSGCGSVGFLWTAELRRQIALLETLCRLIHRIQTELRQRNTPLPEILEEIPGLDVLAKKLRTGMTVPAAAQPYLLKLAQQGLPQTTHSLSQLCEVLGRYDGTTQAAACDQALGQMEVQKADLLRELQEKGKLYHTVPLFFGAIAALAIL